MTAATPRLPAAPPAAVTLAGPRLPDLERLGELLVGPAIDRGLIGPREAERIWERHLLNCAVLAPLPSRGARVADVGSGAGLPGLVLAVLRPDLDVTLVEPLLRRSRFLEEAARTLGLDAVTVRRARAEDLAGSAFDVVTARAVAPLDRLAGWCLPMLRAGGELLALKGAGAADELGTAESALRGAGAIRWSVEQLGAGVLEEPTWVVRVTAGRGPVRGSARHRRRRA